MTKLQIEIDIHEDDFYCNGCDFYIGRKLKCRLFNEPISGDARCDECFNAQRLQKKEQS